MRLDLPRGGLLFMQGARPRAMYCVLGGEVRLVRTSAAGAEIVLQRTRSGFVAEASLNQQSYHCDALVTAPSAVLAFPRADFRRALQDRGFQEEWLAYVSAELRRARAQSERLMLRTARERIVHFIETEGRDRTVTLGITKKDWAAELGLSHEALYRTLRSMADAGELREGPAGAISLCMK
jgi:CRP-like cAMP-binding protein